MSLINVFSSHWPAGLPLRENERERLKTWIYKLSMKPLGINEISVTETGIEWKGGGAPENKPSETQSKWPKQEYQETNVKAARGERQEVAPAKWDEERQLG